MKSNLQVADAHTLVDETELSGVRLKELIWIKFDRALPWMEFHFLGDVKGAHFDEVYVSKKGYTPNQYISTGCTMWAGLIKSVAEALQETAAESSVPVSRGRSDDTRVGEGEGGATRAL